MGKLKVKKGASLEALDTKPDEEVDREELDEIPEETPDEEEQDEVTDGGKDEEPEKVEDEEEESPETVAMIHSVKEGVMTIAETSYEIVDYIVHVLPEHVQDCISHGLSFKG